MNNKGMEFKGKMPDGKEVRFCNDGHHWRGFLAPGKPVGEAYIKLASLTASLGAVIEGGQNNPDVAKADAKAAAGAEVAVAATSKAQCVDGTEYEIRHDGYHFRAFTAKGEQVEKPYMAQQALLNKLCAVLVVPALPVAGEPEANEPELHAPDPSCPMPGNQCRADNAPAVPETTEALASAGEPALAAPVAPADVTQCGQHHSGFCAMDQAKCDGLCGEHANRAPAAYAAAKEKEESGGRDKSVRRHGKK